MYTTPFTDATRFANVFNPFVGPALGAQPYLGQAVNSPLGLNQAPQFNINPYSYGWNAMNCATPVAPWMLKHGQPIALTNHLGQTISGYVIIDAFGPKLVTLQGGIYSLGCGATNGAYGIGAQGVNVCGNVAGITLVPVTQFGG